MQVLPFEDHGDSADVGEKRMEKERNKFSCNRMRKDKNFSSLDDFTETCCILPTHRSRETVCTTLYKIDSLFCVWKIITSVHDVAPVSLESNLRLKNV